MKLKKENLMPAIVLGSICLIVAALLAVVNKITYPVIEKNDKAAIAASYSEALPGGTVFDRDITEEMKTAVKIPSSLVQVIEEGTGHGYVLVISTSSSYSKGNLNVTLGVTPDGKIAGMKITSYYESRDIRNADGAVDGYLGGNYASLSQNGDVLVSGATFSSTAFRDAVAESLGTLQNYLDGKAGK